MRWRIRLRRRLRRVRATTVTQHYVQHKEAARSLILERLQYFNQFYGYTYKRVAIRNQRRCWGSCSSKGNLNFNYKLLFLEPHLRDYVIVHELCHLSEMNHGSAFWQLVEKQIPHFRRCVAELRALDALGLRATQLEKRSVVVNADMSHPPTEFHPVAINDRLLSV